MLLTDAVHNRPAGRGTARRVGDLRSPYSGGLRYVPGLDGLRAIAVGGVLLYHARVGWLPGGFLGVDLFFVLSGYLITSLLLAECRRRGRIDLVGFWAGRARRLLPAATLVIATSVIVVALFFPGDLATLRANALSSLLYFNNWQQILASHSYFAAYGRPSLLQHYWSLAVEEQFYLVWPPVLAAGLALRRRGWVIALAIGVAVASALLMALLYDPSADPSRVYYGTDTRATPLMVGALLAFAWPLSRLSATAGRGARLVLDGLGIAGVGAFILAMATRHDYDPFLYRGGFAIVALVAAAAVAASVHPASHIGIALGTRPLRWVGQRSYGIYLWHWPVMALSRPGIDVTWGLWLLVPAQIAVTVALAALSYRYVEMPVRRRGPQRTARAWLDRRRPRQRLATVTTSVAIVAVTLAAVMLLPAANAVSGHRLMSSAAAEHPPRATANAPVTTPAAARQAAAAPPGVRSRPAVSRRWRPPGAVLAVGASVMLAAEPALEHRLGARVDAKVGRQASAIIRRLAQYRSAGVLPSQIVVQIGDNGPLLPADVARLRAVLRGVPHVVLVNIRQPRSWEDEVDHELAAAVRTWPQATIADWRDASTDPSLLYDGAHPKPAGAAVYADVVARTLALAERGGAGAAR
ncbi:MAG: acyltransferase [Solirubrobacterales bacterium]|nr:acyltransferase [Solirubrobacterales bacterium]